MDGHPGSLARCAPGVAAAMHLQSQWARALPPRTPDDRWALRSATLLHTMGLLNFFRRSKDGIRIRCGMCSRVEHFPFDQEDRFPTHSCDSPILVRAPDPEADAKALRLLVRSFARGPETDEGRDAARNALMYESGEGPIPGFEDLLYRLKYQPKEPFPPPELAAIIPAEDDQPRIDWSNELEMILHRMKAYALTHRAWVSAPNSTKPILKDKLERLKTDPLEPIEG